MNHHTGQNSSNLDTHSNELQLAVLTQRNKRLTREIFPLRLNTINTKINLIYFQTLSNSLNITILQ